MAQTDPSSASSPASHFEGWSAIAPQLWETQHQLLTLLQTQMAQPGQLDPLHLGENWQELLGLLWAQPDAFFAAQIDFWQRFAAIGRTPSPSSAPSADRRFRDPRWHNHPYFAPLRQSHELLNSWWQERIAGLANIDDKTRLRLQFTVRQAMDAISPSNAWWSNPEVLDTTLQQRGQNLLKGMQQLIADMGGTASANGRPRITMAKPGAFAVGQNLAITPGQVILENDLMQVIQYTPQTDTVHSVPIVIMPPWINKYYILDLQAENSFIQWLVQHGYTVFVASWASATSDHRETDFTDYLEQGLWTIVDVAQRVTGQEQVNVIGYCIGGTLTTMGLAERAAKRDRSPIKSVTFLTTLIDFADAGELTLFTDEKHIARIEGLMAETGYLDAWHLHTTFNLLRANDLIWSFVVNNYLLGKDPFPFDLLHWNSDSTHIPAKAHSFYLREMYLHNKLAKPDAMIINDTPLDVGKITTPACFISTREDHIAPWLATYRGAQLWGGPVDFILAGSGHIAGVVNPPAKGKYGYWTNAHQENGASLPRDPDGWVATAAMHEGSWWPQWEEWLRGFSGKRIAAAKRQPGGHVLTPIEPAPGRYVQVKVL